MRSKPVVITLGLSIILGVFGTSSAETSKSLKAMVEPLSGETDIANNTRELEVTVCSQAFSDLAVTDISISPISIATSTIVDVWATVKNKGSNVALNVPIYLYTLVKSTAGEIGIGIIGVESIESLVPSEEGRVRFDFPIQAPEKDGYNIFLGAGVPPSEEEKEVWDNNISKRFSIQLAEDGRIKILHAKKVHQSEHREAGRDRIWAVYPSGGVA